MGASSSAGPVHHARPWAPSAASGPDAALHQLPGMRPAGKGWNVDEFLAQAPPQARAGPAPPDFSEFERIYSGGRGGAPPGVEHESAVAPCFKAFMDSGKAAQPFAPMRLPSMALSLPDQVRIRDRALIMARQMFAEQGGRFADAQVGALLSSLNIDPAALPPTLGKESWEGIYAKAAPRLAPDYAASQALAAQQAAGGEQWAQDFEKLNLDPGMHQTPAPGAAWAAEFAGPAPEGWAGEFAAGGAAESAAITDWVDDFQTAGVRERGAGADDGAAREQSRRLAETLAANRDPKFQNSQFLKFMSKMSRGEVSLEEPKGADAWAGEFAGARPNGAETWAGEFAGAQPASSDAWAGEFAAAKPAASPWGEEFASFQANAAGPHAGDWANQFAEGVAGEWASEFHNPATEDWQEEYAAELERMAAAGPVSANGAYVMAENNPFLNDTDSLAKGRELFRKGVLTEAVLAIEAECQRAPGNAEAWRLLGCVQAENDDDSQAIAAMNRALAIDPNDLETLLSLGVSHTNELDTSEALRFLQRWVTSHPQHGAAAAEAGAAEPADPSQRLAHVTALLERALGARPRDADLHTALGVVHNLARRYDEAAGAFRAALELRPGDYSLWNKLGATLANSSQSREAVPAYRRALELKPNYMRAWTNMGISYSNLADYDTSARFYVRALTLNPRAAAVWSYLRTALMCGGRTDLLPAAQAEDLAALSAQLPL